MGYQKWISKQQSRKPFSRTRKSIHTNAYTSSRISDFTPHKSKQSSRLFVNIEGWLWIAGTIAVVYFAGKSWLNYVHDLNTYEQIPPENTYYAPIDSILLIGIEAHFKHNNFDYAKKDIETLLQRDPTNHRALFIQLEIAYIEATDKPSKLSNAQRMLKEYQLHFPLDTLYIQNLLQNTH